MPGVPAKRGRLLDVRTGRRETRPLALRVRRVLSAFGAMHSTTRAVATTLWALACCVQSRGAVQGRRRGGRLSWGIGRGEELQLMCTMCNCLINRTPSSDGSA